MLDSNKEVSLIRALPVDGIYLMILIRSRGQQFSSIIIIILLFVKRIVRYYFPTMLFHTTHNAAARPQCTKQRWPLSNKDGGCTN